MDRQTTTSELSLVRNFQASTGLSRFIKRPDKFLAKLTSHLVLLFFTIVIVYPVFWMFLASFKASSELINNLWGWPGSLQWANYIAAWDLARLDYALFNSVVISVAVVILVVMLSALAGYAFSRFRFPYDTAIFLTFIFTMLAPTPFIPLYVMLVKMGLTDSRLGLILPLVAGGIPLSIFIFRAFFQSIPRELLDAAKVDGCNEFNAFLRVVVPISGPAVATVAILQFVGAWNEYLLPLVLIRSPEMRTLPLAIQVFFREWRQVDWPQVFAALSIGSLPMIIIYIILQRRFIQGLTAGAIKE